MVLIQTILLQVGDFANEISKETYSFAEHPIAYLLTIVASVIGVMWSYKKMFHKSAMDDVGLTDIKLNQLKTIITLSDDELSKIKADLEAKENRYNSNMEVMRINHNMELDRINEEYKGVIKKLSEQESDCKRNIAKVRSCNELLVKQLRIADKALKENNIKVERVDKNV